MLFAGTATYMLSKRFVPQFHGSLGSCEDHVRIGRCEWCNSAPSAFRSSPAKMGLSNQETVLESLGSPLLQMLKLLP